MPSWITNLILGIISSLIAALIAVGIASFLSKAARWILTGLLGRLLDIDTEIVFSTPREAATDIQKELSRSREIRLMTGRGSELQRETFAPLFSALAVQSGRTFKILLPETNPEEEHIDWVERREKEVMSFDPPYGGGLLKSQITTTLRFLESFRDRANIVTRSFDFPLIGRILLTDSCGYLTPYAKHSHSRETRVIKYRRGGDMYDFLARIFDEVWDTSKTTGWAVENSDQPIVSEGK